MHLKISHQLEGVAPQVLKWKHLKIPGLLAGLKFLRGTQYWKYHQIYHYLRARRPNLKRARPWPPWNLSPDNLSWYRIHLVPNNALLLIELWHWVHTQGIFGKKNHQHAFLNDMKFKSFLANQHGILVYFSLIHPVLTKYCWYHDWCYSF